MPNIRKLAKDEAASTKMEVRGKTVSAVFSARKDKDAADRYSIETELNFGNCSNEEILELAARIVLIDLQRQWRAVAKGNMSAATKDGTFAKVDVKTEVVDAARKGADPTTKVVNVLDKMSDAERNAILAKYAKGKKAA